MNGAGKSTLLKILSKVTVPTVGSFVARGRLGALIEIGAGFHPELTGRENIFLNGSIMGMSRREVQAKFDRIVAFAEVERFIETPIKHYSSGMQMRLGFAVAAHTDPDILLIDEILAVGDASFQAKCLNKLAELKEQDKTIILVSHNLANITQHARRVVWLDQGAVRLIGEPDAVIDAYLEQVTSESDEDGGGASGSGCSRDREVSIVTWRWPTGEGPQTRFDRGDVVLVDLNLLGLPGHSGSGLPGVIQDAGLRWVGCAGSGFGEGHRGGGPGCLEARLDPRFSTGRIRSASDARLGHEASVTCGGARVGWWWGHRLRLAKPTVTCTTPISGRN
jgi:ABC-type polysaccharide/polyol phosphate transport system ATPase subunit